MSLYYDQAGDLKVNAIIRECVKRGMRWNPDTFSLTLPKGKIRSAFPIIRGYRTVNVTANGVCRSVLLARIICWLSHGEPPSGKHVVDHIDRSKLHDHPLNLRWATRTVNVQNVSPEIKENRRQHILRVKTRSRGEKSGASKLTESKVRDIRRLNSSGMSHQAIGVLYGVTPQNIGFICKGKTWRHVQ